MVRDDMVQLCSCAEVQLRRGAAAQRHRPAAGMSASPQPPKREASDSKTLTSEESSVSSVSSVHGLRTNVAISRWPIESSPEARASKDSAGVRDDVSVAAPPPPDGCR